MQTNPRARRPEQKKKRRQAILDAALLLWLGEPNGEFTMERLAVQTGLAKGTLYLYFSTKEELFLALLEAMCASWNEEVCSQLRPLAGKGELTQVARILSRSLTSRDSFTRLLLLVTSVLKPSLNAQAALNSDQRVRSRIADTAAALEEALPKLLPGVGQRLLVHAVALATGLRQLHENDQILQSKCLDGFEVELDAGLAALLGGQLSLAR